MTRLILMNIKHFLMQANKGIMTHQRNFQVLMVEVFKIINSIVPQIEDDFFRFAKIMFETLK